MVGGGELPAVLVVDVPGSKDFGTGARANAEIALELAAVLALSANRNNDRVALLLVTDEVELFIPPGTGRSHSLRLLLTLLTFRPKRRGTKPSKGLDFVARVCRPRSILFLISDFVLDASELKALSEGAGMVEGGEEGSGGGGGGWGGGAVTFQSMARTSSPTSYSRRCENSRPWPRKTDWYSPPKSESTSPRICSSSWRM